MPLSNRLVVTDIQISRVSIPIVEMNSFTLLSGQCPERWKQNILESGDWLPATKAVASYSCICDSAVVPELSATVLSGPRGNIDQDVISTASRGGYAALLHSAR
jgi:hypothetical protein